LPGGAILGDDGVDRVAEYVQIIGEPSAESHLGKAAYEQNCTACYGLDGAGNVLLRAPRINDDIWLYGGDLDTLRTTLRQGRFGIMPAFDSRLDDFQIKLRVALLAR
jgi:cytochrome c oxidase cbb3-type subunit 3